MRKEARLARFEEVVLPHLDAAYNLARWLTHTETDAEDVVQIAYLRAFRFFDGFRGGDGRSWIIRIVRNSCYTWLQQNRTHELTTVFDEEVHGVDDLNPETVLLARVDRQLLRKALKDLPAEFREVIVLRELEGLSYKEIAGIVDVPMGTVMSRLARGRKRLQRSLADHPGRTAR
jgi:RNA polymerase sigma-70 factor, ECF subfamily